MLAEPECISCILSKQEKRCRDENKDARFEYLKDVLQLLFECGSVESSPQLCERIDRLYGKYFEPEDFKDLKRKYNSLILEREDEIRQSIETSDDPIAQAVKYACAGNYIDFHAVEDVAAEQLDNLLQDINNQALDKAELTEFKKDISKARSLIYLTDNCGEIVLDKLLIEAIKSYNPALDITVIVRGNAVSNDATAEDAEQVGLTKSCKCIRSGSATPGIVPELLNKDLKQRLNCADVIISKGQGNFEGMYGSGLNTYYLFLCKCELFTKRFGLDRFTPVFAKESRLIF